MEMWRFGILWGKVSSNIGTSVGFLILFLLLLVTLLTPWIVPHDPVQINLAERFVSWSKEYPLGTDFLGRCLLSRLICGLRTSLVLATIILFLRVAIGVTLGLVAGYFGRLFDRAISRFVDFELAFPEIVLALVIVGMLGQGSLTLILALSVVGWSKYTRVIRSVVVSVKERTFVESARAIGGSSLYIMLRHVLPNSIPPIIPMVTLGWGSMIITVGGLSLIGLWVEPGTPELGMLIKEGFAIFPNYPHLVLLPSFVIVISAIGSTLLGDGLRDVFDPRKKRPITLNL